MKYRSIFIANIAEIAKPLTRSMTETQRRQEVFEDHVYCDRFLAHNKDYRVLITPYSLDPTFIADVSYLLRFKHSLFLHPKEIDESICEAIISDQSLLSQLQQIIMDNPEITIHSYAVTEEFKQLIHKLRSIGLRFSTHEMPDPDASWTAPFFDSKAGFRQTTNILYDSFPDMPRGIIVSGTQELIGWMRYYLLKADGVVLKSNRGLAGAGLRIIRKGDLPVSHIASYVQTLVTDEAFWLDEPIIVEEYIDPDLSICGGSPNIELQIQNGTTEVLYSCGMRVSSKGVFLGVEFGKGAVPKRIERQLVRSGRMFGSVLSLVNYAGHFEIDFVYGKKSHRLFPIEANVRRTGGTHAFELAERLLGDDFIGKYYVISVNKIDAPQCHGKTYSEVKEILRTIMYPMLGKEEGVIITMTNYMIKGKIGYVIIAKDKIRAQQIEHMLLNKLQ
jgi:hypothetical protein